MNGRKLEEGSKEGGKGVGDLGDEAASKDISSVEDLKRNAS